MFIVLSRGCFLGTQ